MLVPRVALIEGFYCNNKTNMSRKVWSFATFNAKMNNLFDTNIVIYDHIKDKKCKYLAFE